MTAVNWEEQPGGLLLAVNTVETSNPKHLETVVRVMSNTFQAIAQKHGASFDANGLRGNLNALLTGRMHADLYLAKWKDCAEEICVGAAFGWKTYGFTRGGVLVKAEYTEDVALSGMLLRALIRTKPPGKEFPDECLAECFERISLRNMFLKKGAKFRFGEVSLDNTTMMRQLLGNGALIGKENSALVEFERLPNNLMDRFPMHARAMPIVCDGAEDKNNFFVRLNENEHDMRFVVTHAQATGKGKSRVDVRGWDNGNPIEKPMQECAISSSLLAIKRGVEGREWGTEKTVQYPSVMASLLRARPDLAAAMYPEKGINSAPSVPQSTFPVSMPETHMSINEQPQLLNGIYSAGGVQRVYGREPISPVVNILSPELG